MRSFTLPDGSVVELQFTGKPNGPSQRGGQQYGTSFPWYRVNGGEWHRSIHRNLNRFCEWVACCETLADFYEGERNDPI